MEFLRHALVIAEKDLRLELRSRERLVSMLTFTVLVAVVFSFSIDPTVPVTNLAGAMVWVTIILVGLLGLGRSFSLEREQEAMAGILLAPVDRGAVFLGKFLANLALLLATEVLILPVYGLFFQLDLTRGLGWIVVVMLLASVGFMALGTLFSAMAINTRLGEMMIPILLLPLLIPVVIFAAASTHRLMGGRPVDEVMGSMRMLLAFDLVFLIVCTLIFGSVMEE